MASSNNDSEIIDCTEAGFSLLSTMFAMGISLVVMTATSEILDNTLKGQRSISQNASVQNLATILKMSLSDPAKCTAALKKKNGMPIAPTSVDATTLDMPDIEVGKIMLGGTPLAETDSNIEGIKIRDMKLIQVASGNPVTLSPYTFKLHIEGTKPEGSLGGKHVSLDIPVTAVFRSLSAPTLINCSTSPFKGEFNGNPSTGSFEIACSKLAYPGVAWFASGCPNSPHTSPQANYYYAPMLNPPPCPSGFSSLGVSVSGLTGGTWAGFNYSRSCVPDDGLPVSVIELSCSNFWWDLGGWITVGCSYKPIKKPSLFYWEAPTLSPPNCPPGFSDQGVSVKGKTEAGPGGFVHSRICTRPQVLPHIIKKKCSNLYFEGSGWISSGCAQIPFTLKEPAYYEGQTLEPEPCPPAYSDWGISVDGVLDGGATGFEYSRICAEN